MPTYFPPSSLASCISVSPGCHLNLAFTSVSFQQGCLLLATSCHVGPRGSAHLVICPGISSLFRVIDSGSQPCQKCLGLELAQSIWGRRADSLLNLTQWHLGKVGQVKAKDCRLVWKRQSTKSHPTQISGSFLSLYIVKWHIQGCFKMLFWK